LTTELDNTMGVVSYDLIQDFGKTVVFSTYPMSVDSDGSTVTLGDPTAYTVKVSPPQRFTRKHDERGLSVLEERLSVTLPSGFNTSSVLAFTPTLTSEANMTVTMDSKVYRIVGIDPLYAGDQIVAYDIHLAE